MTVVAIAIEQLGVAESGGPNKGLPFDRYSLHGESPLPWCARFVRWCFSQAGARLPGNQWEIGNVAAMRAALDAEGGLVRVGPPRAGDIVFVRGRGKSDAAVAGNHVGIVERVEGDVLHTIEGNWSDKVQRVQRDVDDVDLWGFGRWPL